MHIKKKILCMHKCVPICFIITVKMIERIVPNFLINCFQFGLTKFCLVFLVFFIKFSNFLIFNLKITLLIIISNNK